MRILISHFPSCRHDFSGDKDFIEADIEHPLVFSPSMLYDYLTSQQK